MAAFHASDRLRLTRHLLALGICCLIGVGIAATIEYEHAQIARGFTTFCGINDKISCDRVLSSPYAQVFGIPIAMLGLAAYAGLAVVFLGAWRSRDDAQRLRLLGLGGAGVVGSLVFSGYMAFISGFMVGALCLLCSGLYVVALVNTGILMSAFRLLADTEVPSPLSMRTALAVAAASIVGVVGLARLTWPSEDDSATATTASSIRSVADVQKTDPDFYKWYLSLPKVPMSSILREGQLGTLPKDKVIIVDFFDLECTHCKKNYYLVKKLLEARGDQVQLVHRHFPLDATCNEIVPMSLHPNACRAAEAVECAGLQGKHDEMLDILFANQGQLFAENLPRLAGKIGLDKEALQKCLDEHTTLPLVLADARAGAKLEITSTPTVFIGGRRIQGVLEQVSQYEMAVVVEEAASQGH